MPNENVVYWDSCTFIHRIQQTPEHIDVLRQITDAAEKDKLSIVTSAFTLCEVAKVNKDVPDILPEEQERLIVDYFENPYIVLRSVDRAVAKKAREILRFKESIKGKDAVHVATAVLHGIPIMHTFDRKLQTLTGAPCIGSLRIQAPSWESGTEKPQFRTMRLFNFDEDIEVEIEEEGNV